MEAQDLSRGWARAAGRPARPDWQHMELDQVRVLADRLAADLPDGAPDPDSTLVRSRPLAFYPGHSLAELVNPTIMPDGIPRYAVFDVRAARLLDGGNAVIYDLNRTVPIALTAGNVRDYVRLFFAAVRGRHGYFHVVESLDAINFAGEADADRRAEVEKAVHPLILERFGGADGGYRLRAAILFKDGLFAATVGVAADGMVTLSDERMVVETVGAVADDPVIR